MDTSSKLDEMRKELQAIVAEQKRNPGYQGVRVILRTAGEGQYEFLVENFGRSDLWDLQFDRYEVIGPLRFGIDDTHIKPSSPPQWPLLQLASLPAGSTVSLHVERWKGKYWPPERNDFSFSYALRANDSQRRISSAALVISRGVLIRIPVVRVRRWPSTVRTTMPTFRRLTKFLFSIFSRKGT